MPSIHSWKSSSRILLHVCSNFVGAHMALVPVGPLEYTGLALARHPCPGSVRTPFPLSYPLPFLFSKYLFLPCCHFVKRNSLNVVSIASTSLILIMAKPNTMEIAHHILAGLNLHIDTSASVLVCCWPGCFYVLSTSGSQVTTHLQRKHSVQLDARKDLSRNPPHRLAERLSAARRSPATAGRLTRASVPPDSRRVCLQWM
jgi:hypothetical protein